MSLQLSVIIVFAVIAGLLITGIVRRSQVREGWLPQLTKRECAGRQRALWLTFATIVAIAFRPSMYIAFWLTLPQLQCVADEIARRQFTDDPPAAQRWIGCYWVDGYRKCPHGFVVFVDGPDMIGRQFFTNRAHAYAFVYKNQSGECAKFKPGRPLAPNWYCADWR